VSNELTRRIPTQYAHPNLAAWNVFWKFTAAATTGSSISKKIYSSLSVPDFQ